MDFKDNRIDDLEKALEELIKQCTMVDNPGGIKEAIKKGRRVLRSTRWKKQRIT